jgi:hypothetical protein
MKKTLNQLHYLNNNIASKLCQVYNPELFGITILRKSARIELVPFEM